MKISWVWLTAMVFIGVAWQGRSVSERPKPLVVELFTSEGCSSCPPADRFLIELQQSQPIDGALILPLGEHVDYWDRLGWKDPYSAALFSERQRDLARIQKDSQVYTPQMVINGKLSLVGSRREDVLRALREAAQYEPLQIDLVSESIQQESSVELSIQVSGLDKREQHSRFRLRLAVTEDHLKTDVPRGENAGRVLQHAPVVRRLKQLASFGADYPTYQQTVHLELATDWNRENLAVVVFAEDLPSLEILGAASLQLDRKNFSMDQ